MINHLLVFFVSASFGAKLCAGEFDKSRYDRELGTFGTLEVYDVNGQPVELTKERGPPSDSKGDVTFKLYTTRTPSEGRELKINDATSLKNSGFDPSRPTYMITHGWQNNENSRSCVLIRDAYLANIDANVIVVDWSSYSMSMYYIDVTYKVKEVGEVVQQFIKWLYENGLKAEDVTLVGHCLGAHVFGLAGHGLNPKVNNIVGLDPALPMFFYANNSEALSREDANHVQIIHTNRGMLGSLNLSGHSDFFPNGGTLQPSCCGRRVAGCVACSHDRAYVFFAESIAKSFVGIQCDSYSNFIAGYCDDDDDDDDYEDPLTARMGGLDLDSVRPGAYYLRTNPTKLFSRLTRDSISSLPVALPKITDVPRSSHYDVD